jgi:hypothetical protein
MDIDRQVEAAKQIHLGGVHPHNVNRRAPLSMGRSVFPEDAVARIYQPCRSVLTSRRARTEGWRLVFERRTAPFIEPLMGYMGGTDTLAQIELNFPTLEAAVCYAERQGLAYNVRMPPAQASERCSPRPEGAMRAFSDTGLLEQLGPAYLQESYGYALAAAANRNEPAGHTSWNAPMDVVQDRTLSLEAKRSALMSWAWTEHLIDKATNEGMPENGRSSRLDEVERAVFALERQDIGRVSAASMGKAA